MGLGLIPISSRILVQLDEEREVLFGKIIIPENITNKSLETFESGTVLQIGGNAFDYLDECPIREGDRVFFTKYAGISMATASGQSQKKNKSLRYRILRDDDVQCLEGKVGWLDKDQSWYDDEIKEGEDNDI